MRQLNFRAWDTKKKKMIPDVTVYNSHQVGFYYDTGLDIYGSEEELPETQGDDWVFLIDDVEIMQFTGLKDKNGKEIYEGDIVMWGHVKGGEEDPLRIAEVVIDPDIQFHCKNIPFPHVFHFGGFIYTNTSKYLEVIGNKYETPKWVESIQTPTHD